MQTNMCSYMANGEYTCLLQNSRIGPHVNRPVIIQTIKGERFANIGNSEETRYPKCSDESQEKNKIYMRVENVPTALKNKMDTKLQEQCKNSDRFYYTPEYKDNAFAISRNDIALMEPSRVMTISIEANTRFVVKVVFIREINNGSGISKEIEMNEFLYNPLPNDKKLVITATDINTKLFQQSKDISTITFAGVRSSSNATNPDADVITNADEFWTGIQGLIPKPMPPSCSNGGLSYANAIKNMNENKGHIMTHMKDQTGCYMVTKGVIRATDSYIRAGKDRASFRVNYGESIRVCKDKDMKDECYTRKNNDEDFDGQARWFTVKKNMYVKPVAK